MESIKRFLLDETATAEATSSVVMIAAVGILLAGAIAIYYASINNFFSGAGTEINSWDFKKIQ